MIRTTSAGRWSEIALGIVSACLLTIGSMPASDTGLATDDPDTQEQLQRGERVRFVKPEYPAEMRERGMSGSCLLDVIVDTRGRVTEFETLGVSPDGEAFCVEAIRSVCQWLYEPTVYRGLPVPVSRTTVVEFSTGANAGGGSTSQHDRQPPADGGGPHRCDDALLADPSRRMDEPQGATRVDVSKGGPEPLAVGYSIESMTALEEVLPGFSFSPLPSNHARIVWLGRGISADLELLEGSPPYRVESITYRFAWWLFSGKPGLIRTGEGLGYDSSCEDVAAAYGTPESGSLCDKGDGDRWFSLSYRFGGTQAVFGCAGDELVNLMLRTPAASP